MKSLLAIAILLSGFSAHAIEISIENDADDCTRGWMSMDVTVKVGDFEKDFDPSCRFSFSESFKTDLGLECRIEAGMCSAFSPKNKIVVKCDGESEESVAVDCPEEKTKK